MSTSPDVARTDGIVWTTAAVVVLTAKYAVVKMDAMTLKNTHAVRMQTRPVSALAQIHAAATGATIPTLNVAVRVDHVQAKRLVAISSAADR